MMAFTKPICNPLTTSICLTELNATQSELEKEYILCVPYKSVVGSLMYGIRPDLPQAVSMVSRHMGKPRKEHWQVVKTRPSTTDIGQDYQSKTSCALARYSYFDYTTNLDAR